MPRPGDPGRTRRPVPHATAPRPPPAAIAGARAPAPRIATTWPADQMPSVDAVRAALAALDGVDLSDLEIALARGQATIDGTVAGEVDRDRIVRAVNELPGVLAVIDTLRLRT